MSINLEKENAAEELRDIGLEISEFDNKMTILYKIAARFDEPTAHFVIYGTAETGFTYLRLTRVVYSYLVAGKPLVECYQEILSIFVNIIPMDIAMTCRKVAADIPGIDFFDQEKTIGTDLNAIIRGINQMFKDINSKQEQDLIVFSTKKGDTYNLKTYYVGWNVEKKEQRNLEKSKLKRINDIQGQLMDIEPVVINDVIINTFTYRFKTILLKTGLAPRSEDGMTVFEEAKTSEDVPYIQFDSIDGKNYYWMYDLSARSSELSPELFQPYLKESQPVNSITFLLNMQEDADGKSQSKTNFIRCVIRLEDGSLKVKIPGDEENYVKCRRLIEAAFPNLKIGDAEQIHLVGYFTVPNIIITEASYYYHMMATDSLSREYLYLKEGTGSWADKTQQNIHYKDSLEAEDNSSSVIISFDSYVPGESNDVIIEGLSAIGSESANVPGTIKFVIKADSRAASVKFIKIFGRLLAEYSEERSGIEKRIRSVIQTKKAPTLAGDNTQSKKTKKKDKTSTDVARSKLANLRRRTPDGYFDSDYSISCQCGFQPLVIQRDEVEDWRQYTFVKNGKSYPRKTAPYPPIELEEGERIEDLEPDDIRVEYWLVCPRNSHPYPAYKSNHKIAPSYDKLKFVPCCGKRDTLFSPQKRGEKVTTKVGKHQLTTLTLLDQPGRVGFLGKVITQLMQSEASESDGKNDDEESEEEFKRIGIDIGVNSLILCVLKATQSRPPRRQNSIERQYNILSLKTSDRNKCARSVRKKILDKVDISAFRQELYDLSDKDIEAEIRGKSYFDSARLYRGLEEMFKVNIFVFRAHVDKSKLSKEDDFVMEIPRSKLIHIRPFREDRESVLIFKHYGSKIDKSPFPHCELIAAHNAKDKKFRYLFGEDITRICYKVLMKTRTTLVWSLPEGAPAPYTAEDIVTRRNPFSVVNWAAVFDQLNPIGQQVDSYGKARALTLEVSADVIMTIFIPPSQPFNLKIIDDISQISEKLVLQIFGAPSGISANGLWYPGIDFRYCLFIPTDRVLDTDFQNPTSTRKTLRRSPKIWEYNPVNPQKTNLDHYRVNYDTRRRKLSPKLPAEPFDFQPRKGVFPIVEMRTIERNMFYLVQLTEWLFALRSDKKQTFSKWWQIWTKYYIMIKDKVNSEVILPAHLPKCASTEEGFSYLNGKWPVFFRRDRTTGHWKIFMYKTLRDQLFKYLNKDAAKLQRREPALLLRGTHTWDSDFKPRDSNSYFFSGAKSALTWIDYQTNRDTTTFISNKAVAPAIAQEISKFPYLYKDSHTTKIFIIQNVKGSSLSRVINVCHIWATTAQNKGFLTDKYELGDFPPYVVYTISSSEDMIQVRDNSDGDLNYYHVVQYSGEERYAAMLPLI